MAERMTIAIESPEVDFVVNGETLATFKYFDLEQAISDLLGSDNDVVAVRSWMIERGLPESVNVATVDQWLFAYVKANNDRLKKMSGS